MRKFQAINPNNFQGNTNLNYQNTQFYQNDTFMGIGNQNANFFSRN